MHKKCFTQFALLFYNEQSKIGVFLESGMIIGVYIMVERVHETV